MAAPIQLRCVRPMWFGAPVRVGEILDVVSPLRAHDSVASGRAEYVNPEDRERVQAAVAADRDKLLGLLGSVEREQLAFGRLRRVG